MKLLVIGCGGIGSYLIDEAVRQVEMGQLEAEITIADNDSVEPEQLDYQSFQIKDVGLNKAEQKKSQHTGKQGITIETIKNRISKPSEIEGYDFVILCVDNEKTRATIVKACHENDKHFLDLRSSGRRIMAIPKLTVQSNMKFIDQDDTEEYSCQEKSDLEEGRINIGNKIVALIGVQMLLNHARGQINIPQTVSM